MPIALFVFLIWSVHTNPEIFEKGIFFLHESVFRPHKTSKSAHLNGIFLKPLLIRLKWVFFIRIVKTIGSGYCRF